MSYLFVVENSIAKPNTETLLISPFKEIWERDKSKDKSQAIKEFTYIEFMVSKKKTNPYTGYDPEARKKELGKLLFNNPNFEEDYLIIEGLAKLEKFQTEGSSAYTFLLAAETAANKLKDFFLNFDLNERNTRT